jgi:molybdate transport system substrate-binding protein
MRFPSLLLLLLTLTAGCTAQERALTVFAASSLSDAFQELAEQFEARHGIGVELNFAGSNTLRIQIEQGARADLFASASEEHIRALAKAGYVERVVPFAENRLVIVVPASNPANVESVADLRGDVKLVIAGEAVPAGKYAREALRNLESLYGPGFAAQVLSRVVSSEDSVRGVLAKVALGEADAGFVYATDALAAGDRVRVVELPPQANVTPRYYAGVISGSENREAAQTFIAFLLSPEGREILRKHGFEVAE